jgi:predicted CXXCH cytochrome family protein
MKQVILVTTIILAFHLHTQASRNHSVFKSTSQCITCHPLALPTHKKDSPESMSEDWPLDKGSMTCLTCHNCTTGSCILRRSPPELCRVCHDCTQGMACVIGVAHMGSSKNQLDFIRDCQICHDGTLGKEIGDPMDHTVNVDYQPNKDFKTLRDRRVVLFDGKITCVSCHNPYSTTTARLIKDNTSSKLCLTCHNK